MYNEIKIIPNGTKREKLEFYNTIRNTIMTDVPSLAIHRIDIIEYKTKMDIDLLILKLETLPIDTNIDLTKINPFTEFIFEIDINETTNNILTPKNIKTDSNCIISLDENYTIYVLDSFDIIKLRIYAEIDVPRSNDKWKSCYRCYRRDSTTDGFSILFRTNKPKTLDNNINNFIDMDNRIVSKYSLIDSCYNYLSESIKIFNTLLFINNSDDLIAFTRPSNSDSIYAINIKRIIIKHIFNLWLALNTYYAVKYNDFTLINNKIKSIINMEIVGNISDNKIIGLLKILSSLLISPYLIAYTDIDEQIDLKNIDTLNYSRTDKMDIKLKIKLRNYGYFTDINMKDALWKFVLEVNKLTKIFGTQFDKMINLLNSVNSNDLNKSLRKVGYYIYFDTEIIWE